jgi:hypothetical protein
MSTTSTTTPITAPGLYASSVTPRQWPPFPPTSLRLHATTGGQVGFPAQRAREQERMAKLRQSGIFDDSVQGKKRQRRRESESTHLSITQPDTAPSSNETHPDGVCSTTTASRRRTRLEREILIVDLTNDEPRHRPRRIRKLLVPGLGSSILQTLDPASSSNEALQPLPLEALAAYESD